MVDSKLKSFLVSGTALAALSIADGESGLRAGHRSAGYAARQQTPTGAATPVRAIRPVMPTTATPSSSPGSRIRQDPNNSALPLQIITNQEIQRNGISSPEQLMMYLPSNGTGPDNLASNSDVVTGAQRGTNGLSSANLRGQGNSLRRWCC